MTAHINFPASEPIEKGLCIKSKKTGHPLNMRVLEKTGDQKRFWSGHSMYDFWLVSDRKRKLNNIIQQNLKNNLIRFHVRANSNSRMDGWKSE